MEFEKFEHRPPSPQNAFDIFRGKWASDFADLIPVETGGAAPIATGDPRPVLASEAFGREGRLEGFRVLELGPLEAGHTFQFEQLGAREIVAIEANVEAYLKCLIVKEAVGLSRSRFLLGDFCEYLETTDDRFDLVFASGVLYHMADPIGLIESIGRVTDRCFVWTHYYDPDAYTGPPRTAKPDTRDPRIIRYEHQYGDMGLGRFWGGNVSLNVWLSRADILSSFESVGLRHISVLQEHRQHENGAAFSFVASRMPLEIAPGALASSRSGLSVSRQDRPEDDLIDTRPMKWFFAVNGVSLQLQRDFWQSMILAAVRSARQHTDLAPHLLFDGDDDPFLAVLERLGVTIVRHRVSFYDALERHDGGSDYLKVASATFLRTEIPAIEDDPFVLYTDCDVMFTGEVSLGDYRPNKFACAPEFQQDDYADFNAGVMVMNVKGLRDDLDEFTAFIRENLSNLQAYDQGAYRMFYEGHVDPLDPIYNWKPYWGTSRDARIVHFHGVKPQHVEGLIHGETLPPVLRNLYDQNPVSYQRYVEDWTTLAGHA